MADERDRNIRAAMAYGQRFAAAQRRDWLLGYGDDGSEVRHSDPPPLGDPPPWARPDPLAPPEGYGQPPAQAPARAGHATPAPGPCQCPCMRAPNRACATPCPNPADAEDLMCAECRLDRDGTVHCHMGMQAAARQAHGMLPPHGIPKAPKPPWERRRSRP
jgi:hypothetical protein